MRIIGITGGVGSGKSEILNILAKDYQGKVIMADQVAHQLMEPGTQCYKDIVGVFGEDILCADQTINRNKLGNIVFHDAKLLGKLNAITHERVDEEILRIMDEEATSHPSGLVVCEAAIFVGAQYEKRLEEIWYIYTKEEVRRERLRASRGYSEEKMDQMMTSQQSEEEFRKMATTIIDNSGTMEETKKQIAILMA